MKKFNYLGFDLDGTISDSMKLGAEHMRVYFGKDPIAGGTYEEMFGVSKEEMKEFMNLYASIVWKECLPIPGAVRVIRELWKVFDISIITNRPQKDFSITRDWLRKWKVPYTDLHLIGPGNKKCDFPPIQKCFCFVEDEIEKAKGIADKKIPTFVFNSDIKYNNIINVKNWEEIGEYILLRRFDK